MPPDLKRALNPPGSVLDIASKLERDGHETWCVGGAVRDALLGMDHLDWDLATAATPQQVRRVFRRTVPVGIEFGTVGVLDESGTMYEVTTFRRDVRTDGRHAEVEFGVSLDDDLARRDLTINAIAYSPARREMYDPFDGQSDLRKGVIRAVGVAADRIREDRLRALRAIRFAARFGFSIEPATWAAIAAEPERLRQLSPERVKQELEKTLQQVERPSRALELWRASGALGALLPALAESDPEAIAAVDCVPRPGRGPRGDRRRRVRLATLLSGMQPASAGTLLRELRFSNADAKRTAELVRGVARLDLAIASALATGPPAPAEVRRLVAEAGRALVADLLRVLAARWGAKRAAGKPAPAPEAVRALYGLALRSAYRDPVDLGSLAVDGDDLRRVGISPGPAMARILHGLLAYVLEDPVRNQTDELLAHARKLEAGFTPTTETGRR